MIHSVTDILRQSNMDTWLEHEAVRTGTADQQARYRAGDMTEAELRLLARVQLFAPFSTAVERGELARWHPMHWSAVDHERPGCVGRVDFSKHAVVGPVGKIAELAELGNRHEWMTRTATRFRVQPYQHIGTCRVCRASAERVSVHVSCLWAGRSLAREYVI